MIINFLFKNLGIRQTVIKNTFWLAAAEAISRLLKLILIINVARVLGATEYGKFTFALSFVAILVVFSDFGLSSITTRELSQNKENENEYPAIFSLKMILSLGVLILIIIGSFFITLDPIIQKIIRILAFYIIIVNFSEIIYAFFRARQKMEYEAFSKIIQALLVTGLGLFVVLNFASIENLSLSYLLASLFTLFFLLIFFNFKIYPLKISLQKSIWKKFAILAYPLGLTTILATTSACASILIMGRLHLITEIGWYNAAIKLARVLVLPSYIITQVFYPITNEAFKNSKEKLQKVWDYQMKIQVFFLTPLMIGAIFLAPKIIDFVYGSGFKPSVIAFQILILGIGLANNVFAQALVVANKQKKIILNVFCMAVTMVTLSLILIPKFSLYGAALSFLIAAIINFLLLVLLTLKFTTIKPLNSNFFVNLIGSLISSVLMYFVISYPKIYNLNIFISAFIGIFTYLIFILLYKKLTKPIFNYYR